jgi:CheY-like chemotaxis protein
MRDQVITGINPIKEACDRSKTLVVDDEAQIVRAFMMMLSSSFPELRIEGALDGRQAVDRFGRGHHGILVMDLNMPVLDGRAAFDEIRRLCRQRNWDMPAVIFCTGYSPAGARAIAPPEADPHRNCVLQKPVGWDDIVEAVRKRL